MAADDGASIGDVYVTVLPKVASDWSARLQSQLDGPSKIVAEAIGKNMGSTIQDAIARGMADGIDKGSRSSVPRSTRAGDESGGAFADAFKRKVEAALKALPDIKIDANSSQAQRRITELRAELDELSNRRVGVDIDAASAQAKLTAIRAELDRINSSSGSAQLRTDAGRAAAELAAFQAEVDRLDGRHIDVAVDDSEIKRAGESARESSGGIGFLAAAGLGLGPALVPGAAAGAAAIAGIIPMAVGAAGGIGVLALSMSGVLGAVKAMSAADDSAGQTALALASRQSQLASASDQVRSAQAGLANTLANVSDQQQRAAEQVANAQRALVDARINADRAAEQATQSVANAEQTLTNAQRAALTAQRDLTTAREDAKRANEDLANQVVDNAHAQERAVIAVQDAQQQLNAVMASPLSTTRQREEARLSFEEAKQHALELQQQGERLAADKAKSDAAGIEGSKQVLAAQQQVTTSQQQLAAAEYGVSKARADAANTARTNAESIAKAEQALSDAQQAQASQARQAAFSVAQAQQGVVSAQRALEQATVQAGQSGSAAMDKLHQSMALLSPEGQRFATFLYGLKPTLLDLRRTAEAGLLPGAQQGIEALLPTVPRLTGYVHAFSSEVGLLAAGAGRAFASPYWGNFFDLLVSKAIPAMDTGAHAAYNFAVGIAGLIRAALPIGQDFGSGLLHFSEQFAIWSNTIERSQGYRNLLDYVRTTGPEVAHTIGDVVQAAVRLVEAIAPLGGGSLTTIRLVAQAINALPVDVLTTLAGGIGGVVLATRAWSLAQDAWKAAQPVVNGLTDIFSSAVNNAKLNMFLAQGQTGNLGIAMQGLKGGLQGAGSAAGTLAGAIGPGGALGIALAGAAALVGVFVQQAAEQRQKVDSLTSSLNGLASAYGRSQQAGDDYVREQIQSNEGFRDLIKNADNMGISLDTITQAVRGNKDALDQVNGSYDDQLNNLRMANELLKANAISAPGYLDALVLQADVQSKYGVTLGERIRQMEAEKSGLDKSAAGYRDLQVALGLLNQQQGAAVGTTAALKTQQDSLQHVLDVFNSTASTATDKVNALKQAQDAMTGSVKAQTDAEEAYYAAVDRSSDALARNKGNLDVKTAAGREDIDALKGRLSATNDAYYADIAAAQASGNVAQATADATQKHRDRIQALIDEAVKNGADRAEVQHLVDVYGTIPGQVNTDVKLTGVDAILRQLEDTYIAQRVLSEGITVADATRRYATHGQQPSDIFRGHAEGGLLEGPWMGPRADNLLIRANPREFIHNVAAVDYYGVGLMNAINARAIPREALLPGYATGGLVDWPTRWPFTVDVSHAAVPQIPALVSSAASGGSGVDRWAPMVLGVLGQLGQSADLLGAVLRRMNFESGGNPLAVNRSDSNWYAGTPSVGLMQVIGPTFARWAGPYRNVGPFEYGVSEDGAANTFAGLNYAIHRYGSIQAIDPLVMPTGYDSGGPLPEGLTLAYNGTGQTEQVYTAEDHARAQAALAAEGGRVFRDVNINGSDGQSVHELAKAVVAEISWMMR